MPATRYKVWALGPGVGKGVTGSIHAGVAGVAKASPAGIPYAVANELICGHLARSILLPTPPGFIIDVNNVPHHVSLNFNLVGQDLPPADAAAIAAEQARLATGILAFDIWVYNNDRHPWNLAYDKTSCKVQVFDHSHAFLHGASEAAALASFASAKDDLGIGGHCLMGQMSSFDGLHEWLERICAIPTSLIRDVLASSTEVGLPTSMLDYCLDWLSGRRYTIEQLIRSQRGVFPKISADYWDGFQGGGI